MQVENNRARSLSHATELVAVETHDDSASRFLIIAKYCALLDADVRIGVVHAGRLERSLLKTTSGH